MKSWFTNNLWWILQLMGCCAIISTNSIAKIYGLHWWTWGVNVAFCAGVTAWAFTLSYEIAPTFLQPWFVAQGTLGVMGFLISLVFFDMGLVKLHQILGALLCIIGGVLLVI